MPFALLCVFAGISLAAALGMALTRRLIYAAFLLFAVLFAVGALFVFVQAEFLAVSQVLVYVGGVLILLIFGIMLTDRELFRQPTTPIGSVLFAVPLVAALLFGLVRLVFRMKLTPLPAADTSMPAHLTTATQQLAFSTLTSYLLPFELIAVLLLIVLIGAAYIARPKE